MKIVLYEMWPIRNLFHKKSNYQDNIKPIRINLTFLNLLITTIHARKKKILSNRNYILVWMNKLAIIQNYVLNNIYF